MWSYNTLKGETRIKRKKTLQTKTYILTLLMLATLCGCKDSEELGSLSESVRAELAFTVSTGTVKETRMASGVVQSNSSFHGLQTLRAFPFAIASNANAVTKDDTPKTFDASGYTTEYTGKTAGTAAAAFYYKENCTFMPGVNAFLAYANADTKNLTAGTYSGNSTIDSKLYFGYLSPNNTVRGYPEEIGYAPEQMLTSADEVYTGTNTPAKDLADYLTRIADAAGWSTTTHSVLKAYYLNFIGQGNDGSTALIASSSDNILQYVKKLREQVYNVTIGLSETDIATRSAIIGAIDAYYDATNGILTNLPNYPVSLGLPAGAAAVRWTGSAFVPQTQTTTVANINTITRFAFPAELYYRTNSRIKTSTIDNRQSAYSKTDWSQVLSDYERDNGTVSSNTTAVAIKEPLQYAVGRLDVKLNACSSSTLKDANNKDVTIGSNLFPLTGIIVGSQRPVDFEFKPKDENSDLNVRFTYDPFPTGSSNAISLYSTGSSSATTIAASTASTLALQTPNGEEVTIILEFENNSGTQFRGRDGVVYPRTKFYLIGKLTPEINATEDYKKRVFTQDYTTTVNMTVSSLENAYNVMPDILSGRLEVGVELVTDWVQATPETVTLN